MAKKRSTTRTRRAARGSAGTSGQDDVQRAAAAVDQARRALEEAETAYQEACRSAPDAVAAPDELTVGDLLDGTLEFVRRFPAAGILTAGVAGFLLGRSMRG